VLPVRQRSVLIDAGSSQWNASQVKGVHRNATRRNVVLEFGRPTTTTYGNDQRTDKRYKLAVDRRQARAVSAADPNDKVECHVTTVDEFRQGTRSSNAGAMTSSLALEKLNDDRPWKRVSIQSCC
jgi:hypothetical protein